LSGGGISKLSSNGCDSGGERGRVVLRGLLPDREAYLRMRTE
jgi:hypothetical protein